MRIIFTCFFVIAFAQGGTCSVGKYEFGQYFRHFARNRACRRIDEKLIFPPSIQLNVQLGKCCIHSRSFCLVTCRLFGSLYLMIN